MKLLPILITLLPTLTLSTPIAGAEADTSPANVLSARDVYCNLHPDVRESQGCDHDRWGGNRKREVKLGERFGVRCWSNGKSVNGNTKWDYVPGWGCWISARWTSSGCESNVPHPCQE